MSEFMFYQLERDKVELMKLPVTVFPVRREMEKEIFDGEQVAFDLLLDELDVFLAEYPECIGRYRDTIGLLAYIVGIELGAEGYHDAAAHYLEVGLAYNPDNISLRTNYAIALQSLGRKDEAVAQYEYIINDPEVDVTPIIWILAARLYSEKGDYMRGYRLLRECAMLLPEENAFWDFLAELKEKAGVEGTDYSVSDARPEPVTKTIAYCSKCGAKIRVGARFCSKCGAPVKGGEVT